MLYSKFEIKNFQGIESVEVDLTNNRILTLVGLNESGKTTILSAINLFYKFIKGEDPTPIQLNLFRTKGIDFTGTISIKGILKFEDGDATKVLDFWKTIDAERSLEIGAEFSYMCSMNYKLHKYENTARIAEFKINLGGSTKNLYEEDEPKWQKIIEFIRNMVPEILFYEDFVFDIPEKIEFSLGLETPATQASKNKSWQLVLDDILKAVKPELSFREHIVSIWQSDSDTANNRISQIEVQLNEKITSAWKELFHKDSKRLNFKEIKLKCDFQNNILSISFQVKTDSGRIFSINERSKGCKWFFSFLLFTEFRKNRTRNILFLLDEPASNLHSSAQAKILEAIDDLSDKAMVIYSTHSHHLIKVEWLAGAYVVVNDLLSKEQLAGDIQFDETAKIKAIKYFRYVGEGIGSDKVSYFQPILDALDYQPSQIEPTPNIVILEGKNDWYTIKYFLEILLKLKKPLHFYPGAGVNKLSEIIRLYLSWGKNFIVIVDNDKAGIEALASYKKEFGEILDDRLFTLGDIGLAGEMEAQIDFQDKVKIHDTIYGAGSFNTLTGKPEQSKSNLNYAIMHLLATKAELSISESTTGRFKKIATFSKSKLKE